jgi:hypothetical protein
VFNTNEMTAAVPPRRFNAHSAIVCTARGVLIEPSANLMEELPSGLCAENQARDSDDHDERRRERKCRVERGARRQWRAAVVTETRLNVRTGHATAWPAGRLICIRFFAASLPDG